MRGWERLEGFSHAGKDLRGSVVRRAWTVGTWPECATVESNAAEHSRPGCSTAGRSTAGTVDNDRATGATGAAGGAGRGAGSFSHRAAALTQSICTVYAKHSAAAESDQFTAPSKHRA